MSYIYLFLHNTRSLLWPSSRHGSSDSVYILGNLVIGEWNRESRSFVRVEREWTVSRPEVPLPWLGIEFERLTLGARFGDREGEVPGRRERERPHCQGIGWLWGGGGCGPLCWDHHREVRWGEVRRGEGNEGMMNGRRVWFWIKGWERWWIILYNIGSRLGFLWHILMHRFV